MLIGGGGLLAFVGCFGFIFTILLGTEAKDAATALSFLLAGVTGAAIMLVTHAVHYVIRGGA